MTVGVFRLGRYAIHLSSCLSFVCMGHWNVPRPAVPDLVVPSSLPFLEPLCGGLCHVHLGRCGERFLIIGNAPLRLCTVSFTLI